MQRDTQQGTSHQRDMRHEVTQGLLYTHSRLNANTAKTLEGASFLYALIELMSEKGLISIEELDERKNVVGERLSEKFRERGMGAMLQEPERDKYDFHDGAEIDCENRVHLCKATCCRLPFALSEQDLREGIVHWDLGQPYMIDQGDDGFCDHFQRGSCGCGIYEHRPVPCRGFDCRTDQRIWLDFENKIPNPLINRADWPDCLRKESERKDAQEENGRNSIESQ